MLAAVPFPVPLPASMFPALLLQVLFLILCGQGKCKVRLAECGPGGSPASGHLSIRLQHSHHNVEELPFQTLHDRLREPFWWDPRAVPVMGFAKFEAEAVCFPNDP